MLRNLNSSRDESMKSAYEQQLKTSANTSSDAFKSNLLGILNDLKRSTLTASPSPLTLTNGTRMLKRTSSPMLNEKQSKRSRQGSQTPQFTTQDNDAQSFRDAFLNRQREVESLTEILKTIEAEKAELQDRLVSMQRIVDTAQSKQNDFREAIDKLKEDVQAKQTLLETKMPKVGLIGKLKDENRALDEKIQKLQKSVTTKETELDYIRKQWRDLQDVVASLQKEKEEVVKKYAKAEPLASGQILELRKLQFESEREMYKAQIKRVLNENSMLKQIQLAQNEKLQGRK